MKTSFLLKIHCIVKLVQLEANKKTQLHTAHTAANLVKEKTTTKDSIIVF